MQRPNQRRRTRGRSPAPFGSRKAVWARSLPRCRPRSGGFRPINICPRLAGWRPKRSSGRGGRREMVRLPEDLKCVLDPVRRLALPGPGAAPPPGTRCAGGGGAAVAVDGIRLTVTSICFGVNFRPGRRCQRSDDAHAKAKPAPMTRTHPARGVQVVLKLLPAYCPRNCGTGILRSVLAAGGIVNTIANDAYSDEAQEARKAIPA